MLSIDNRGEVKPMKSFKRQIPERSRQNQSKYPLKVQQHARDCKYLYRSNAKPALNKNLSHLN